MASLMSAVRFVSSRGSKSAVMGVNLLHLSESCQLRSRTVTNLLRSLATGPGVRRRPGAQSRGPPSRSGQKPTSTNVVREQAPPPPLANDKIQGLKEVRCIDQSGANLGVLPFADAIKLSKERQLDLILVSPTAVPPVCRIASLPELLRERQKQMKEAATAARAQVDAEKKQKEVRLTARTDDHDLAVKARKVVEFLRDGSSVKVSISFTLSAWAREEPARREVMAKVVRSVAESGAGWCDPAGIKGEGAMLMATFVPVTTPKPQRDWDKVLLKLASPQRGGPEASDSRMAHPEATVAAALGGTAKASTLETMLPPTDQLLKNFRKPKKHAGRKPGETLADDATHVRRNVEGLDDVGMTGALTRGRRLTRG